MTGDVFLSWSTPDEAAIMSLKDGLVDVGLKVWEYKESSLAGGVIPNQVVTAINTVEIAIICFTDETADREWIVREAEWSYKTWQDGDKPLRHIIPVWVGEHPQNKLPPILAQAQLNAKDLVKPTSAQLSTFIDDLFRLLGREAPRTTPAALFAMTAPQWQQLLKQPPAVKELTALCAAAGVKPAAVKQLLSTRYGARADDFEPFTPGQTFLDLVNTLLREANRIRVRRGRRPVVLKWMQDEIVGPAAQQHAREEWAAADSLLVIDAASSFHPDIQVRLLNLPQPKHLERATVVWLPPFTQHTAPIEQSLRMTAAAANVGHLGDAFSEWQRRDSLRAMTFDAFTYTGAALWLRRALIEIEDVPEPIATRVSSMRAASSSRFNLGTTMAGPPGP